MRLETRIYTSMPLVWLQPPLTPHICPGNDLLLEEERVSESAIMFKWRSVSFVCWLHKSLLHIGVTARTHPFVLLPSSLHWSRTLNDHLYRLHGNSQQYVAINGQAGNDITDRHHINQTHLLKKNKCIPLKIQNYIKVENSCITTNSMTATDNGCNKSLTLRAK